jgi:pyruvate/2-oxoglutarate dehydrogenase complex dihydrolipoamide dehydrogenase (E3) component
MKVITLLSNNEKVIGMHYFGPSADEVISGYAVAMKLGLTKKHLDMALGVHPSNSEDFHNLEVTKRSGEDYSKTEC